MTHTGDPHTGGLNRKTLSNYNLRGADNSDKWGARIHVYLISDAKDKDKLMKLNGLLNVTKLVSLLFF